MNKYLSSLTIVLLVLIPFEGHAEIYKCKAANGKTSFQGEPCADSLVQKVLDESSASSGNGVALEIVNDALVGTWCFYQQSIDGGDTVAEKVTIKLNKDGSYSWSDVAWKQKGKWSLQNDVLLMTDVGRHTIKKVTSNHIDMQRYSNMKWRRGGC